MVEALNQCETAHPVGDLPKEYPLCLGQIKKKIPSAQWALIENYVQTNVKLENLTTESP
jgi:hypothetical protein